MPERQICLGDGTQVRQALLLSVLVILQVPCPSVQPWDTDLCPQLALLCLDHMAGFSAPWALIIKMVWYTPRGLLALPAHAPGASGNSLPSPASYLLPGCPLQCTCSLGVPILGFRPPQTGPSQACEALSPEDSGLHALTIDRQVTEGHHSPEVGKIKPVPQLTTIRPQAHSWNTLQCHVARRMGVQPHG